MDLEEFKKKLEESLIKVSDKETAQRIMKEYEKEFRHILEEGWTVEGITPALLMNLY